MHSIHSELLQLTQKESGITVATTWLNAESRNVFNCLSSMGNQGPGCLAAPSEFPQDTDGPGICKTDIHSLFSNLLLYPEKSPEALTNSSCPIHARSDLRKEAKL